MVCGDTAGQGGGQARLSGTAQPAQGYKPVLVIEKLSELRQLVQPPDERREPDRNLYPDLLRPGRVPDINSPLVGS